MEGTLDRADSLPFPPPVPSLLHLPLSLRPRFTHSFPYSSQDRYLLLLTMRSGKHCKLPIVLNDKMTASCRRWRGDMLGPHDLQCWKGRVPRVPPIGWLCDCCHHREAETAMFVSQHHTRCEQWSTLREMLPSRGRSEPHHQPNWGTGRAVPPSLVGTRASRFPVYDSQMTRLSPTDRPTDRASSHGSHSPTLLQTDGRTEGHSIYRASIA